MVIRGAVFDIDDTLYLERDYVLGGFRYIADLVGSSTNEREAVAAWLEEAFRAGHRGDTFDRLLEVFPAIANRTTVDSLVEAYRRHPPVIELARNVQSTLGALRQSGLRLGIVSDGPLVSQRAKADALHLDRWFDPIVLTASLGRGLGKPATAGFQEVARSWGLPPKSLVYVADNPEKDFAGPRALGWLTVRLRQPEQLRYHLEPKDLLERSDQELSSIVDLLDTLEMTGRR